MTEDNYIGTKYHGFKVVEKLGEGRFSRVYALQHGEMEKLGGLALKVYHSHPELAGKEAAALSQLDHQNIIRFYNADLGGISPTIVLERADTSLRAEMGQKKSANERVKYALDRITQVLTGLSYAHKKNILHKDLKPENILIKDNVVKLTDFNLSKDLEAMATDDVMLSNANRSMSMAGGTHGYTAPEGAKDARSDVYSVGAILYEMLTGRLPQGRFPAASKIAKTPVELDAIIDKALAQDPNDRYKTADELLFVLQKEGVKKTAAPGKGITTWKEWANAGEDTSLDTSLVDFLYFPMKEIAKLPFKVAWGAVKYTIGLPITLLGKHVNSYDAEAGCAGFIGILGMYAAMTLGTLVGVNYYSDQKLANELKTSPPKGRIVYYDHQAGRISYANSSHLGLEPSKTTTIAHKLQNVRDIAPSADGNHVYVLHEAGQKNSLSSRITRINLETGEARTMAASDQDSFLGGVQNIRVLKQGSCEQVFLKSANDWYELKDGKAVALKVFPPELSQAAGNISPDRKYKVEQAESGQVRVVRHPDTLSLAEYVLGQAGPNACIVWSPEGASIETVQPLKEEPKQVQEAPATTPAKQPKEQEHQKEQGKIPAEAKPYVDIMEGK